MDCVFIGDSIAQGVAQYRTDCQNQTARGRTTGQTLLRIHQTPRLAHSVIISVGSNDLRISDSELRSQVQSLRSKLVQQCVTWLLPPSNQTARTVIAGIAGQYGDRVIDVRPHVNSRQDPVHPNRQGYQNLADLTQQSVCKVVTKP